jgi:hypothetical protein
MPRPSIAEQSRPSSAEQSGLRMSRGKQRGGQARDRWRMSRG